MSQIDKIVLWTWPDADHDAAFASGMAACELHEWKARLAAVMDDLQAYGHEVVVVTIPVAEILSALKARGLENTPDNRAIIATYYYEIS